jgi:tripartite-type tricarboxylate transporter receptor subunit TctC
LAFPQVVGRTSLRLIGQWLSERFGQQFIIENRAGANANIATEAVVKAQPDGYTLLLAGSFNATNATLYEKLTFNFMRDVVAVAPIVRAPFVMEVHPSVPARTLPEFIAYTKANPGKINMASTGVGNATHISGELFKSMAGVDMVHVPYRGSAPAMTDLLGGQVQLMFDGLLSSIEHIRAGKLRPLGVTTAMCSIVLPDLPAIGEFLPGFEASLWYGLGAPRSTLRRRCSISSIRRSTRPSPTQKLGRGLQSRAARQSWARPLTSHD